MVLRVSYEALEDDAPTPKWYNYSRESSKKNYIKVLVVALFSVVMLYFFVNSSYPQSCSPDFDLDGMRSPEHFLEYQRPISLGNASAIFNTIHNAMRVKPSLLNPVGVSFIPAYIPEGTLLYHGSTSAELRSGLEWVAMDPEFSYWFIANRGGPNKGPRGPGGPPDGDEPSRPNPKNGIHNPGKDHGPPKEENDHPTVFTLEVVKPLDKIILLDGASAAKLSTGEMDTQVILSKSDEGMDEREMADKICKWGESFDLDGYIRLEVSFEAVICNMKSDKLRVINSGIIPWKEELFGEINEEDDFFNQVDAFGGFEQLEFGAAHDSGDKRVLLDFRGMVTPINKTWIDPDTYLRRVVNISQELKDELIYDLEEFFHGETLDPSLGTNWQLITDEIVYKLAPLLKLLNQTYDREFETDEEFELNVRNITLFTSNFARRFHVTNNTEEARKQAIYQYSHPLQALQTDSDVLIWSSLTKITGLVVDVLFDNFEFGRQYIKTKEKNEEKYKELKDQLHETIKLLQWTDFVECSKKCSWDEICYTPSWGPSPMGWGNTLGTYVDENRRKKADENLHCISFRDVLEQSQRHPWA